MQLQAVKLTIYLTEDDRVERQRAWEVLLERAREDGMAGATVWRGIEGFGRRGFLRSSRFIDASQGMPVTVELVDEDERIDAFLPTVARLVPGALVLRQRVRAISRESAAADALDDPRPSPSSLGETRGPDEGQ